MQLTRILTPVAFAAAFVVASQAAHAQSQAVYVPQLTDFQLTDPSGSGRSAVVQFVGGYGQLDFNNGSTFQQTGDPLDVGAAVEFLAYSKLAASGTSGASFITETQPNYYENGSPFLADARWESPSVGGMMIETAGANAGRMGVLNLAGGFSLQGTRISGTLTGGQLEASNIRVDLVNKQVIADVSGTRTAIGTVSAQSFSAPATVLWTFDQVSGPTSINPSALLATDPVAALASSGLTVVQHGTAPIYQTSTCYSGGTGYGYPYGGGGYYYPCTQQVGTAFQMVARADLNLTGLTLTAEGAQLLTNSLGLQTSGAAAMNQVNTWDESKWGDLRVGVFLRTGELTQTSWPALPASIPEPSTYALMGLGLVGVMLARRRQLVAAA